VCTDRQGAIVLIAIAVIAQKVDTHRQEICVCICIYVCVCVCIQTDRELLRSYSPIAADTQKAFIFLSSFSMIGALDKYSKGVCVCLCG